MLHLFVKNDREQLFLLPQDMRDWLPSDDPVWTVINEIRQMNLSAFYVRYRGDGSGRPPFDPSVMVGLLLYGNCLGYMSSRKIAELCIRVVGFRVLACNQMPDHSTISRFRRDNTEALAGLFTEVFRRCEAAGMLNLGVVALDGTKIKANASLSANHRSEWIEAEVNKMLEEAEAVDCKEDEISSRSQRRHEDRLNLLKECKTRLDAEIAEAEKAKAAQLAARAEEEAVTGKKRRGRKPKSAEKVREERKEHIKANVTDPDSRIMKTSKGFCQGYNAQAVVTEDQVIIAAKLTQDENDVHQLNPMLEQASENLTKIGCEEEIGTAVADAGYWSEAGMEQASPEGPELLVATQKDWKQRKALVEQGLPSEPPPPGSSAREAMEYRLQTEDGHGMYKKRGQTVEPVFGQIKDARRCDRFLQRGLENCDVEWKLLCMAHNLLKIWRRKMNALTHGGCRLVSRRAGASLAAA